MKFLDTMHSDEDNKKSPDKNGITNCTLSLVDQVMKVKDQMAINDFASGLDETCSNHFKLINSSKTNAREKALISALLNKYPKLVEDKKQQSEFKSHVENMLEVDKLSDGSLKYLFSIMITKTQDGKIPKEQKTEEEISDPNVEPQAEESEAQKAGDTAVQTAEDSNNSSNDFYSVWEKDFNDTETELTEDQFAELISEEVCEKSGDEDNVKRDLTSNQRSTSEEIKNAEIKAKVKTFLKARKKDSAGNDAYSDSDYSSLLNAEDFLVDRLYSDTEEDTNYSIGDIPATEGRRHGFTGTGFTEGSKDSEPMSKLQTAMKNHSSITAEGKVSKEGPLLPGYLSSDSSLKNFASEAKALNSHSYLSAPQRARLKLLNKRLKSKGLK